MVTEEEALGHILERVKVLPSRKLALTNALDQFAADDSFARLPLPIFDNSAMDGYAVIANSCQSDKSQRLIGEQPAGVSRKLRVSPGETVRVFTGAPIPEGADAVVMQEDVRRVGSEIFISNKVEPGEFIRRRGSDLSEGQKILEKGQRIRAQTLALLAAQGFGEVEVGGQVRAAIITTGDELIRPGHSLNAGQIYESNSVLVQMLCAKLGAKVETVEHCPDDLSSLESTLNKAVEHDVVVVIGGVSVGARDLVKPALAAAGAKTDLWRVSVKPGKPFLFGRARQCAIFGLPGNPVSAFITFVLFVRPALLRMMGANESALSLPVWQAELAEELENKSNRPHYVRGCVSNGRFAPIGRQESHALFGLSQANALFRVPPGATFRSGARVAILSLD